MVTQAVEPGVGDNACGRAGLHIGRAAPEDLAVAPLARPAAPIERREHVDMTVEHEVASGSRALEGADNVRQLRLCCRDSPRRTVLVEERTHDLRRFGRV